MFINNQIETSFRGINRLVTIPSVDFHWRYANGYHIQITIVNFLEGMWIHGNNGEGYMSVQWDRQRSLR